MLWPAHGSDVCSIASANRDQIRSIQENDSKSCIEPPSSWSLQLRSTPLLNVIEVKSVITTVTSFEA